MLAVDLPSPAIAPIKEVAQIWRTKELRDAAWMRGAMDAYNKRRPQRDSAAYLSGYCQQLKELPSDENGVVEWFRFTPGSGWKLTDNI